MPDRKMLRKALECIAENRQKSCTGCEYSIFGLYPFCIHGIARDAIAILKEQKAKPIEYVNNFRIGLIKEKETNYIEQDEKGLRYSGKIIDELVEKMVKFLENHKISELIDLVSVAIATKEDS